MVECGKDNKGSKNIWKVATRKEIRIAMGLKRTRTLPLLKKYRQKERASKMVRKSVASGKFMIGKCK